MLSELQKRRHLPGRRSFQKKVSEGSRTEGIQHGFSCKDKGLHPEACTGLTCSTVTVGNLEEGRSEQSS